MWKMTAKMETWRINPPTEDDIDANVNKPTTTNMKSTESSKDKSNHKQEIQPKTSMKKKSFAEAISQSGQKKKSIQHPSEKKNPVRPTSFWD